MPDSLQFFIPPPAANQFRISRCYTQLMAPMQSRELGNPFDSIESAQEFVRLLAEAVADAQSEVDGLITDATGSHQRRREEALRLVALKLDQLLLHIGKSQRALKDLRTLRRLLEGGPPSS